MLFGAIFFLHQRRVKKKLLACFLPVMVSIVSARLPICCGRQIGCAVVSRLAVVMVLASHFLVSLGKIFLETLCKLCGFSKHSLDTSWQSASRKLEAIQCFFFMSVSAEQRNILDQSTSAARTSAAFTLALHEVHLR